MKRTLEEDLVPISNPDNDKPIIASSTIDEPNSGDKPIIGICTDKKGTMTSFPLFGSAEDYAQSCIRIGMKFSVKAAQAYDEEGETPIRVCYKCFWQQEMYDYWDYWRTEEHMKRYDAPDSKDEESYERRAKHAIKKLRDEAIKDWDKQTEHLAKCPEPKEGGDKYAQWCAYHNHPFDEAQARTYDVEGNIEELPEGKCYSCIYNKKRAAFANMRYTVLDLLVKDYYEKLEDE